MKNDAGGMSMSEEVKQKARAEHYESLLNIEFDCDIEHLSKTDARRPTHPHYY